MRESPISPDDNSTNLQSGLQKLFFPPLLFPALLGKKAPNPCFLWSDFYFCDLRFSPEPFFSECLLPQMHLSGYAYLRVHTFYTHPVLISDFGRVFFGFVPVSFTIPSGILATCTVRPAAGTISRFFRDVNTSCGLIEPRGGSSGSIYLQGGK